jgi:hypothetical protein
MLDYHRRRKQGGRDVTYLASYVQSHDSTTGGISKTRLREHDEEIQTWPSEMQPLTPRKKIRFQGGTDAPVGAKGRALYGIISEDTFARIEEFGARYYGAEMGDKLFEESHSEEVFGENEMEYEEIPWWAADLDEFLNVTALPRSPSPGAMDPFDAGSISIKPRIQELIHHHCEFFSVLEIYSYCSVPMVTLQMVSKYKRRCLSC